MSDVIETSTSDQPGEESALSAAEHCERCQADLSRYSQFARFCPRCGTRRRDDAIAATSIAAGRQNESDQPGTSVPTPFADTPTDTAGPIPPPLPVDASNAAAWMQLSMAQAAAAPRTIFGAAHPNNADVHSLMLLGYANAMYRLGWRYETGLGNGRNPSEALRCYFKAAKLGNTAALSRLAPQCFGTPAAAPPAPPPSLPVDPQGP